MGVKEKGEELITDIRTHINDIENKLKNIEKPKRVYFEISPSPDIYSTGKNTFQQEILQTAGVENIFGIKKVGSRFQKRQSSSRILKSLQQLSIISKAL